MDSKSGQKQSPGKPSNGQKIAIEERRAKVVKLVAARWTVRAIAANLGVSKSTVQKDINTILGRVSLSGEDLRREFAKDILTIEDTIYSLFPRAKNGDTKAASVMCRLLERRAKLLGLDAPTTLVHTGENGSPIKIDMDITRLTDEEVEELERLTQKAAEGQG